MVKLIIFDLDGTLLDTSRTIHSVLNKSLEKFSLPALTLEKTLTFVGDGAKQLIERAVGNKNETLIEEVSRCFVQIYAESDNELTEVYANEIEVLNKLSEKGIKFAIITNKPQQAAVNVCKKFLKDIKFSNIIGYDGSFPLKPNPQSTLKIIEENDFKKEECLFVGDGEADVKTAIAAGIKAISVLWGFRTRSELKHVGAEIFANTYEELLSLIVSN